MNNDTIKVILGDRRQGLTSTVQSDIHEQIVKGQRSNLVVFQTIDRAHFFIRTWHDDFPFVPVPEYTTITNRLKIRGQQFQRIYIEDVHEYPEGIYDLRIEELYMHLFRNDDVEVVFTASRTDINGRSHSANIKPADVLAKVGNRWKLRRK